jgi:hypothetical protein
MRSTFPDASAGGDPTLFILKLSDSDRALRNVAASEIFQRGCEIVRAATSTWLQDSELASCFDLDERGLPKTIVGIAVHRSNFQRIRAANGSPRLANVPGDQDAEEFELDFPEGVRLDILTTKRPGADGAIDKFLQKFGEGVQQVELQAVDVERATEILRSRFGIAAIYPQKRAGADGTFVNFFLVSIAEGKKVLIELVESNEQHHS